MERIDMETVFAIYALLAALAAPIVVIFLVIKLRKARRREQSLLQENARFEEALVEQRIQCDKLLDALKAGRIDLKEALMASGQNKPDGGQQLARELSKISRALVYLAESMEQPRPPAPTPLGPLPSGLDIFANLPEEPEARIATLEQRRQILFSAIRECNQAIADDKRTPLSPGPVPVPEPVPDDDGPDSVEEEQDIPGEVEVRPQPAEESEPGPVQPDVSPPVPPVVPQQEVGPTDFQAVLPEDFQRELVRVILMEGGEPSDESIRLVLDGRFFHAVLHEINERAEDRLGDLLLYYDDEGQLVITEEFVEDLKMFLNDRAIPSRRV